MRIKNFAGDRTLLRNLKNSRAKANRSAAHLATGLKITSAGEDSSAYSISEKMRVRLRALDQNHQNSENGRALLRTAEGGLQQITELMKKMKEITVQSANGIYTDADRRIIDQEYQQCISQIDDIAAMTNYNGKCLLNGSLAMSAGQGGGSNAAQVEEAVFADTVVGGVRTITITSDGRFTIPAGFTGDIVVQAQNVLIDQATSAALTNVSIQCQAGTNLFIEDLNIRAVTNDGLKGKSIIDFQGANNSLVLRGNNTLRGDYTAPNVLFPAGDDRIEAASLVHAGAGTELIINAENGGGLDMEKTYNVLNDSSCDMGGALLGGDGNESGGKIVINGGDIRAVVGAFGNAAAIGAGALDGMVMGVRGGDITVNGGRITAVGGDGAAIGGGADGMGGNLSDGGNITFNGGDVNASIGGDTAYGSAIGGGNQGSGGTITFNGGKVTAFVPQLIDTTTGLPDLDPFTFRHPIGHGSGGIGETIITNHGSYTESGAYGDDQTLRYDVAWTPPTVTLPNLPMKAGGLAAQQRDDGLQIQTGVRANQVVKCYIDDMHADALGLGGSHLLTRQAAAELLGDENRAGAIDVALQSVVLQTTQVGAYQARLLQTEETLTIDAENTTAAESVIRDANMAKEMMEYTKNNILADAGQAMLAQANRQKSSILSLLQ